MSIKSYVDVINGTLFSICVGVIQFILEIISQPAQTNTQAALSATQLVFVIFVFTILISMLKRELLQSIASKTRIYSLLDQITDTYLKQKALDTISECETKLEEISTGTLKLHAQEIYQTITEKMNVAKKRVQATHLVSEKSFISIWKNNEGLKSYFDANVKAIDRHVEVERVFLLRKVQTVIDPLTKKVDQNVWRILQEHHDQGIKVIVTWVDDVTDTNSIEDFIVFDGLEVVITYQLWESKYHSIAIKNNDFYIREYSTKFIALKAIGHSFKDFQQEYSPEASDSEMVK